MERKDVYADKCSGSKANRPQWDLVLAQLRSGDTLVATRLDRLGRSLAHLVNLGAILRERGVDLVIIEQSIDTARRRGG